MQRPRTCKTVGPFGSRAREAPAPSVSVSAFLHWELSNITKYMELMAELFCMLCKRVNMIIDLSLLIMQRIIQE